MLAVIGPSTFRQVPSLRRLLLPGYGRCHVEDQVVLLVNASLPKVRHSALSGLPQAKLWSSNARRDDDSGEAEVSGKEEGSRRGESGGKGAAEENGASEIGSENRGVGQKGDGEESGWLGEGSRWRRIPRQISRALFGERPKEAPKEVSKEVKDVETAAKSPPVVAEVAEPVVAEGAEQAAEDSAGKVGSAGGSAGAIVPAGPRPENFPMVLAIPLTRRPLFPGFYVPIPIKDQKLAEALIELRSRGTPYVGAFLRKDIELKHKGSSPSSTDRDVEVADLRGEKLYKQLHEYGTFAQVTNVIRTVEGETGQIQLLLMGHRRIRLTGIVDTEPLTVAVEHLRDKSHDSSTDIIKATVLEVVSTMKDLMRLNPLYKEHIQMFVQHIGDFNASRLADFGAALTTADEPSLQEVLEELDVEKRLSLTLMLLKKELELSKLQASIAKGVEEKISGEQRRFFLMEQLKAIKKELGLETDDKTALTAKFRERLEPNRKACPPNILQVIDEELSKLQGLEASSSEFNVTRNYLDWLTSIPWGRYSEENFNVKQAQEILDAEHYGLSDVKERILEFIAVGKLRGSAHGKIICLAGPPGVGKTSIGRSIAHALNRKFYRFSVGGLSDVAEIKGHRRTYVGAMPGKMVQCLKATGTANPLVLIDEIDKLGRGHAGDPASALLELLDPEQNQNFLDHYLDVPIDLSKVLFVCTANVVEMIPNPLLDRMEVIRLVGYITDEKKHIARDYLEKAAREGSGVKSGQVELTDEALHILIETYCREAGVRSLQKHIEKIYRKVALKLVRMEIESAGQAQDKNEEAAVGLKSGRNSAAVVEHGVRADSDAMVEVEENDLHIVSVPEIAEQIEDLAALLRKDGAEIGADDPSVVLEDAVPIASYLTQLLSSSQYEEVETGAVDSIAGAGYGLRNSSYLVQLLSDSQQDVHDDQRDMNVDENFLGIETSQLESHLIQPLNDLGLESEIEGKSTVEVDDPARPMLVVEESNLPDYVGNPVFQSDRLYDQTPLGVVMGLAWTAMGGSTLYVETSLIEKGEGKGSLQMTGQLGDVMKESATIAHTVSRAVLREKDASNDFFATARLHLHVPAGATPKDGPSAGCTMITSMLSLAMGKMVNRDVAMTGEVTLTGRVLPIGGVKEKTIAARRSGVKTIIFPGANKRDYDELPDYVKEGLDVHFVDHYNEVFEVAFGSKQGDEMIVAEGQEISIAKVPAESPSDTPLEVPAERQAEVSGRH